MKKACLPLIIALAMLLVSFASAQELTFGSFAFSVPEELAAVPIGENDGGIVYAAQSEDSGLRLVVLCQKVKRSGDTSTAALVERLASNRAAELSEPVKAGDTEFAISSERIEEGGGSVYFRTATAIRAGEQITFFIIDYDGTRSDLPKELAESVKWTD